MSRAIRRRDALARLAALAVLPCIVSGHAVHAATGPAFQPPAGPMVFTRRLRRDLGDGASIDVVRTFEIRFVPTPGGYRVEGMQTSAHVDAPASLAALARLEEQRVETGLFPLELDSAGRIIAGPQGGVPADMSQAVNEAFAWIARHPLTASTRAAAQEFVIGLHTVAARITTAVPPDLFTGNAVPLERAENLTMPDGKPGRVSISYAGTPRPGGGLLRAAQRVVVTDAGGSSMRSVEQWTLEPEAGPMTH